MTKLPEKDVLDGSKLPRTTTGEMKESLGKLRDYLNELLGEDSADKEAARQALGIDLKELTRKIETKADEETIRTAVQNKVDKMELDSRTQELESEIAKKGVPVGSVEYFAQQTPPAGYLKADGAAVGRETYPELFAAIGTTFGAGDGETTFNLPDLIDRFAQGSVTPGNKIEAGLPGFSGTFGIGKYEATSPTGAFYKYASSGSVNGSTIANYNSPVIGINPALSNPIYGASDTVQPPALTLLPCIKAFDAATNPGLVDITELANEMAGKVDRCVDNKPVRYVIDAYNDGTNWYRKWSDGWLEQGGFSGPFTSAYGRITLPIPYADVNYTVQLTPTGRPYYTPATVLFDGNGDMNITTTGFYVGGSDWAAGYVKWYTCGQGALS